MPKRLPENALIEKIEQHDRFQFEIKLEYPLVESEPTQRYALEAFFFVPSTLGINRHTYRGDDFYGDIQDYLRFRTPRMTLLQLLSDDNELSPLSRLTLLLSHLESSALPPAFGVEFVHESKTLANILRVALREFADVAGRGLHGDDPIAAREAELRVGTSLTQVREVLAAYRRLEGSLITPALPEDLRVHFLLVDEFLSLTAESYALHFLATDYAFEESRSDALRGLAIAENTYREERGFESIARADESNELFLYRHSLLKKYVANVLYLSSQLIDAPQRIEPLFFGVAAGVAMAFATAVTFVAATLAPISWSLFAVLVASYIAKDRIKESFKRFFRRWADRHLSDHIVRITDPSSGELLGNFKQKFRFFEEAEVPEDILAVRAAGRSEFHAEREFKEKVFRYAKTTIVTPEHVYGHHDRVAGLTDILRFSVERLTGKMDEPYRTILHLDPSSGELKRLRGHRTYHINVVLKMRVGKDARDVSYKKMRVVLSRKGIRRIEQVDATH